METATRVHAITAAWAICHGKAGRGCVRHQVEMILDLSGAGMTEEEILAGDGDGTRRRSGDVRLRRALDALQDRRGHWSMRGSSSNLRRYGNAATGATTARFGHALVSSLQ